MKQQPFFGERWVCVISIAHSPTAPSAWYGSPIHFSQMDKGASEMEAPSALGFQ